MYVVMDKFYRRNFMQAADEKLIINLFIKVQSYPVGRQHLFSKEDNFSRKSTKHKIRITDVILTKTVAAKCKQYENGQPPVYY